MESQLKLRSPSRRVLRSIEAETSSSPIPGTTEFGRFRQTLERSPLLLEDPKDSLAITDLRKQPVWTIRKESLWMLPATSILQTDRIIAFAELTQRPASLRLSPAPDHTIIPAIMGRQQQRPSRFLWR